LLENSDFSELDFVHPEKQIAVAIAKTKADGASAILANLIRVSFPIICVGLPWRERWDDSIWLRMIEKSTLQPNVNLKKRFLCHKTRYKAIKSLADWSGYLNAESTKCPTAFAFFGLRFSIARL
jgi:hypothetical protein